MISVLDMRSIKRNMGIIDPGFGTKIFSLYAFTQENFWDGAELAFLELSQAGWEYPVEKSSENARKEYSNIICNINILLHVLMSGTRKPGQTVKLINAFTAPDSLLKREAFIERAIQEGMKSTIAGGETMLANQCHISNTARAQNTHNRRSKAGALSMGRYVRAFSINKLSKLYGAGYIQTASSALVSTPVSGFVRAILSNILTLDVHKKTSEGSLGTDSYASAAQRRTGGKAEEPYPMLPERMGAATLTGAAAFQAIQKLLPALTVPSNYWPFAQHGEMLLRQHNVSKARKEHEADYIRTAEAASVVFEERPRFGTRSGFGTPQWMLPTSKSGFVRAILSKIITLDVHKKPVEAAWGRIPMLPKAQRRTGGKAEEPYPMLPERMGAATLAGAAALTGTTFLAGTAAFQAIQKLLPALTVPSNYRPFAQHGEMLLRQHSAGEAWKEHEAGHTRTAEAASVVFEERPRFGARSGFRTPQGAFPTNKSGFVRAILSKIVSLDVHKKPVGAAWGRIPMLPKAQRRTGGKAEEPYPMLPERMGAATLAGAAALTGTTFLAGTAAFQAIQKLLPALTVPSNYRPFAQHGEMLLRQHNVSKARKEHEADYIRTAEAASVVFEERPRFGTRSGFGTPQWMLPTSKSGFVRAILSKIITLDVHKKTSEGSLGTDSYASAAQRRTGGKAEEPYPMLPERMGTATLAGAAALTGTTFLAGTAAFQAIQKLLPALTVPSNYRPFAQHVEMLLRQHNVSKARKEHEADYIRTAEAASVVFEERPRFGARSGFGTPQWMLPTSKSGFVRAILSKIITLDVHKKPVEAAWGRIPMLTKAQRRTGGKAEEPYPMLPERMGAATLAGAAALTGTTFLAGTAALTGTTFLAGAAAFQAIQKLLPALTVPSNYRPFAQHGEMLLRQHSAGEAWKEHEAGHTRTAEAASVVFEERPRFGTRSGFRTPQGMSPISKSGFVKALSSKIITLDVHKKPVEAAWGRIPMLTKAQRRTGGKTEEPYPMLPERMGAATLAGAAALTGTTFLAGAAAFQAIQKLLPALTVPSNYWPFAQHVEMLLRQHSAGEAWKEHEAGHTRTAEAASVVFEERPRFGTRSGFGTPQGMSPISKSGFVKALSSKIITLDVHKKPVGAAWGRIPMLPKAQRRTGGKAEEPYPMLPERMGAITLTDAAAAVKANEQAPSELILRSSPQPAEKGGANVNSTGTKNDNAFISSKTEANSPREASIPKIKVINESREDFVRAGGADIQGNGTDISKLADQIYKRLEERLRIERQRRGLFR